MLLLTFIGLFHLSSPKAQYISVYIIPIIPWGVCLLSLICIFSVFLNYCFTQLSWSLMSYKLKIKAKQGIWNHSDFVLITHLKVYHCVRLHNNLMFTKWIPVSNDVFMSCIKKKSQLNKIKASRKYSLID